MRAHARSFAFATWFLPAKMRPDVYALYAFCRMVDDLVDEPGHGSPDDIRTELDAWQTWLEGTLTLPSLMPPGGVAALQAAGEGLRHVLHKYAIPRRHLIELIEGCKSDLDQPRFEDFEELRHYCYQVGATVGLAMCPILGVEDDGGLACARDLGIAMQLTNVIRDVPEDLALGRRYLPAADMALFPDDMPGLIRFEADRARAYYRAGREGVSWIQPAARFAIRLAATLYEAILDKIAQQRYDVFAGRASTSLRDKLWLAMRLRLSG